MPEQNAEVSTPSSPGQDPLEHVLQGRLKEARVRSVVLEELLTCDLAPLWTNALVGRITPGWMVQQVESIRAELQILLTPDGEVLEQGHIHRGVPGTVDHIGTRAKISNCPYP